MSDEKCNDYIESLSIRKLEKPKWIGQETSRYRNEIMAKQYHFRRGKAAHVVRR